MIDGLLDGVETRTEMDFVSLRGQWKDMAETLVYTGAIDEYFDYCYGNLQYRTVSFETEILNISNYQGNAVINYTQREVPYTRIIEHKHFEMFGNEVYQIPKTVISREYSTEWILGKEPYYPVNDGKNSALYERYKALADNEERVIFGGRLAEYKYYDMDKVIERALSVAKF